MPGSSRMPVSLRDGFNHVKKSRQTNPFLILNLDLLRNIVFFFFVVRWTRKTFWKLKGRGLIGSVVEFYATLRRVLYGYFLRAPGVRGQVQKQVNESLSKLQGKMVPTNLTRYLTLPKEGLSDDMEAEVVAMVLAMFNAPPGAAGVSTSGGTDSILSACLSARQRGYHERGITEPEMILGETAHPAFRKACDYFKIKAQFVPCPAPSHQVDVKAVARLITSNTILIVGSAPNFPHGIIDDITALSKLALRKKICLHVDCCLGSFLVPFLDKAGFETELFDFRLKGVTSISCDTHKYGFAPKGNSTVLYRTAALRNCDTHKYGFAPKGNSTVLYRTAALRKYQYYVSPDWSGGVYGSPGMAGSRPGALIAGCWTSLMKTGEAGYVDACVKIVGTTKKMIERIHEVPALESELEIVGRPLVSVMAFTARNLDIYDIADAMSTKGWHLNALQNPPAIHVAVTLPITKVWEKLMADLEAVVEAEREKERVRIVEGKGAKGTAKGDSAALYGVAGSLPNKSVVVDLVNGFLDLLYKA
ncbi:Sphingosine-1-phosphate lyase like protein [Verticillium longisporum]|uniref:sphinganine-1-phosphate aldolase n=1 Tax=Verticillium longisporum TaxID=100787 RepID=A0A8I2ZNI6_VERLO|nr:Sphingosine-1-phosphate lyase like protein [Verticillium longisporum]